MEIMEKKMKKVILLSTLTTMVFYVNEGICLLDKIKQSATFQKISNSAVGQAVKNIAQNSLAVQALKTVVTNKVNQMVQANILSLTQSLTGISNGLIQIKNSLSTSLAGQIITTIPGTNQTTVVQTPITSSNTTQITTGQVTTQYDQYLTNINQSINNIRTVINTAIQQGTADFNSLLTRVKGIMNYIQTIELNYQQLQTLLPSQTLESISSYIKGLSTIKNIITYVDTIYTSCVNMKTQYDTYTQQLITQMPADQQAGALAVKQAIDNDINIIMNTSQMVLQSFVFSQSIDSNTLASIKTNFQTALADLQTRLGNDAQFGTSVQQLSIFGQNMLSSLVQNADEALANKIMSYSSSNQTGQQNNVSTGLTNYNNQTGVITPAVNNTVISTTAVPAATSNPASPVSTSTNTRGRR